MLDINITKGLSPGFLPLILREFKQIHSLLFPLKTSENHRFSVDFRRNKNYLIYLNSLNIRGEIWRRSLTKANRILGQSPKKFTEY